MLYSGSTLVPLPVSRSLRTLVIDDEPLAREGIRLLVGADSELDIVAEIDNGRDAVTAILGHRPDLVFLDVQMPECDGLTVLRQIPEDRLPIVVFVTAFDRYAIDAFEAHAIDYLLKPVEAGRFAVTLSRVKSRFRERQMSEVTDRLITLMRDNPSLTGESKSFIERIPVPQSGKVQIVPVASIDWAEAEDDYVRLHVGKTTHLIRKTLSTLESELDPKQFIRVHRSHLINACRIKELRPQGQGDYLIVLSDGTQLKLSRSYKERIAALLP
jgi:two-component system, LytTR family, response regulator